MTSYDRKHHYDCFGQQQSKSALSLLFIVLKLLFHSHNISLINEYIVTTPSQLHSQYLQSVDKVWRVSFSDFRKGGDRGLRGAEIPRVGCDI